jgi:hypothetical protein
MNGGPYAAREKFAIAFALTALEEVLMLRGRETHDVGANLCASCRNLMDSQIPTKKETK